MNTTTLTAGTTFAGALIVSDEASDTAANVRIRIDAGAITVDAFDGRQWTVEASDPAAMQVVDTLVATLHQAGTRHR